MKLLNVLAVGEKSVFRNMRVFGPMAAALFLLANASFAQVGTASLSGVVKDPSGAVLPNASVVISSTRETLSRTVKTGADGLYVVTSLPPGSYELSVQAAGFQKREMTGIELSSGQVATLNVILSPAGVTTRVTVSAAAPLMQTTSASLGTEISSVQATNLPILGGSFLNTLDIAPATVPYAPTGTTENYSPIGSQGNVMPSVFGQRQKDNDFLVDGVENRDPDFLGVPVYPPPEAIAEMKVDSGVGSAIYGHGSGATVNIVTKSGSNQWHGAAWEFLRNNDLNAKTYFNPTIVPFRWNQFGGDIGGPLEIPHLLPRSKGWYVFGYYEGIRIQTVSEYTTLVPTAAELSGDFSADQPIYDPYTTIAGPGGSQVRTQYPNNTIPTGELNQTSLALAKALFPAPNLAPGIIPGVNYLNPGTSAQNGDQWSARVDHQFGQHDNYFMRYTGSTDPSSSVNLPTITTGTQVHINNAVVSDTHVISPTFVVTGRYGLMSDYLKTNTEGPAGLADSIGLGNTYGYALGGPIMPAFSIPGYVSPGFGANILFSLTTSYTADAQKVAGAHALEFGGGVIHIHFHDKTTTEPDVTFASTQTSDFTSGTGNAMASFLIGAPLSAQHILGVDEDAEDNQTTNEYGAYVQDTWRHRRFTVDAGLRWDYAAVPVNRLGMGTVDPDTGVYVWDIRNPITGAAPNIRRGGTPPEKHAFAPRLGIAYTINPRTIVRASYGVFFNIFGSQYIQGPQGVRGNYPFAFPQSVTDLNQGVPDALLPDPFPPSQAISPACNQCLNVDQDSSRTPYVEEWTLSLQRQFGDNLVLEADYFGSHGVKLGGQIVDDTATVPGPGPISLRQPHPQYSPYILNNYDEFQSWYEAGALQLRRRFVHGLQFMANYTWSKNLDQLDNLSNAGIGGAPTSNPTRYNGPSLKGPAGFDVPQILVVSGVWSIPGHTGNRYVDAFVSHWNTSGIANFRSGVPFMLFLTTDNENIGTVSGRYTEFPNRVGNPHAIHPSAGEWFNTAAFAVPAPYTIGNVGRNFLRTASFYDTDYALYKTWPIRESSSAELRADAFNVFNHANLGYPGTEIGTRQFGKVSSTINPGRSLQLALRLHF